MSNLGCQLFGNIKGNNLLPSLSLINTFKFEREFNLLLKNNNNNNLLLEGLDSNIAALINTLIELNLMERYFLRKEIFIKLIEFMRTKTKDLNK